MIFKGFTSRYKVKILLVGGAGFIGKRFIRKHAQKNKIIVYATTQDIIKSKNFLNEFNIETEEGVIEENKLSQIIEFHKPDVVIHLAALTGLVKCHNDPQNAFKTNVYGTHNVANSCANLRCKLIFISSREVYGETIDKSTREDDPLLPNNVYGITKMMGENIIQFFNQTQNLDFTILRLTNVFGPEGDQYGAQIIIKKALRDKKIQIFGGSQRLNYVYVDDVVDIIYKAIENKKSSKQIFNVGSTNTITVKEFAETVSNIIGDNIEFEYKPMRETETTNFEPNLTKLQKFFGLPQTSLDEGIKKTIGWYK
jgi:UDP-glucose 4-epimerase